MKRPLRDRLRRIFRPDFFVGEYKSVDGGSYSGSFAALGKTREEAQADAIAYVQQQDGCFAARGQIAVWVRRPNLAERLFG